MYGSSHNFNPADRKATNRHLQEAASQRKAANDTQYFWDLVSRSASGQFTGVRKPSRAQEEHFLFGRKAEAHAPTTIEDSIEVQRSGPRADEIATIETFEELEAQVPPSVLSCFRMMHFHKPTPIQKHAIPLGLGGLDLMCCAQTGSGKTFAFLVPVIAALGASLAEAQTTSDGPAGERVSVDNRGVLPLAIVLAPTRELASQIHLDARRLTFGGSIRSVCVYGGNDIRNQLAELCTGCELIVATPGRLNDLVDRGVVSLSQVSFLVLDEADRMLDMGFEPQIRRIVLEYDMPRGEDRQTFLFSATFPAEIQALAREFLRNYVWIAVGRVGSTVDNIKQQVLLASSDPNEKIKLLLGVLDQTDGRTLVFVQKKRTATWLCDVLRNMYGIAVEEIHGDRTQAQRENALKQFRDGKLRILIATDVAARGLDVPAVTHVIQFDMPLSSDDFDVYVHRIGRTGRAGKSGLATCFFVPGREVGEGNGKIASQLLQLLRENNQEIPEWFATLDDMHGHGGHSHGQNRRFAHGQGRSQAKFGFHDTRTNQSTTVYQNAPRQAFDSAHASAPHSGGYYQQQHQQHQHQHQQGFQHHNGGGRGPRPYYPRGSPMQQHQQYPRQNGHAQHASHPHAHHAGMAAGMYGGSAQPMQHYQAAPPGMPPSPPSSTGAPAPYPMPMMPSAAGFSASQVPVMAPSQYPGSTPYFDPYGGFNALDAQMRSLSLAQNPQAPPVPPPASSQPWSLPMNPMIPPRPQQFPHEGRSGYPMQYGQSASRSHVPPPANYAENSFSRPAFPPQNYKPYYEQAQSYAQQPPYGGQFAGGAEGETRVLTKSDEAPSDNPQ